jgi:hypothetical protein
MCSPAGSIPGSFSSLPSSATVTLLPQSGAGLCGAVPNSPGLQFVPQPGSFQSLTNTLGSCLETCTNPEKSEHAPAGANGGSLCAQYTLLSCWQAWPVKHTLH